MSDNAKYSIDVQKASEILGVSRKTIYRRLRSGELDGKKVPTDNTMKWVINKNDIQQAKRVQESVDIVEVEENISKEKLIKAIQEAVNSQNKQVIEENVEKVSNKIEEQNKEIREQREQIQKQNEYIKNLSEEIKEIKNNQNISFLEKIKSLFK